ncbi:glycosyltransferase [Streptomyces griseoluteus]|uniref:glycosyltransferase n=1 Tax=Streptomyces griseoluteus TaxID=29306 RepID=UPI00331E56BE
MIEAMACGTPVVALRRGSVPEIVEEGFAGFMCDHPAELAQAIGSVDRLDPRACRGRVRRHFDTDQMAAAYAALYQQLCWEHPRSEPAAAWPLVTCGDNKEVPESGWWSARPRRNAGTGARAASRPRPRTPMRAWGPARRSPLRGPSAHARYGVPNGPVSPSPSGCLR